MRFGGYPETPADSPATPDVGRPTVVRRAFRKPSPSPVRSACMSGESPYQDKEFGWWPLCLPIAVVRRAFLKPSPQSFSTVVRRAFKPSRSPVRSACMPCESPYQDKEF